MGYSLKRFGDLRNYSYICGEIQNKVNIAIISYEKTRIALDHIGLVADDNSESSRRT